MKLVNRNEENSESESHLKRAIELEQQDLFQQAEKIYKSIIQANPHAEEAYDRLMIIYRKQKDSTNELKIIDRAISSFKAWFEKKSPHTASKKIARLSSSISRITGLGAKKTDLLFTREPLARWQKRKNLLLARSRKKLQ